MLIIMNQLHRKETYIICRHKPLKISLKKILNNYTNIQILYKKKCKTSIFCINRLMDKLYKSNYVLRLTAIVSKTNKKIKINDKTIFGFK